VLHHVVDGFVIVGVIVLNVTIGFFSEGKAESSTKKLQVMMGRSAVVLRNGERKAIAARDLTLGDIFLLQAGDIVPADGRVLTSADLNVFEASLTGESHPVLKNSAQLAVPSLPVTTNGVAPSTTDSDVPLAERTCMVYSSTQVMKGTATCVVTAVGKEWEMGKIHTLLTNVEELKTPLVIQIETFGLYLSVCIIILAAIALLAAFLRKYDVAEAFSIAIGIAVAAIPEGLLTWMIMTFSVGVHYMAKRNVLVKSLPAVETLGAVSVICSDKTGTLTMNKMTVHAIFDGEKSFNVSDKNQAEKPIIPLITPGIFCNDTIIRLKEQEQQEQEHDVEAGEESFEIDGDPTEACIFELAVKHYQARGLKDLLKKFERIDEVPFDSATKFMATLHRVPLSDLPQILGSSDAVLSKTETYKQNDVYIIFLKGAPERVIDFCCDPSKVDKAFVKKWKDGAVSLAKNGMRVLGLAYKIIPIPEDSPSISLKEEISNHPDCFQISCMIGIVDPPRPAAIEAIKKAQRAGIVVKMITGDHQITALAIGKMLGLQNNKHSDDAVHPPSGVSSTAHEIYKRKRAASIVISREVVPEGIVLEQEVGTGVEEPHEEEDLLVVTGVELDNILNSTTSTLNIVSAVQLVLPQRDKEAIFDEIVASYDVFARTTPEHKLLIVKSLQRQGFVCSMTGDGVNDAPALKAANMGVAMGITGTEVAKEASKMILLDDNFANIVEAIRIGRCTYQNIIKILCNALPCNFAKAFSIVVAVLIGIEIPITALQILWVNLIGGIALGMVLALEPIDDSVLFHKPRSPKKRVFGRFLGWRIIFITVTFVAIIIGNFEWEKHRGITDVHELRTIAVNTISFLQIGYVFCCRSLRKPRIMKAFYGNNYVYLGAMVVVGIQAMFTYAPFMQYVFHTKGVDGIAWAKFFFWGFIAFFIVEIEKYISFFYFHQHKRGEYKHPGGVKAVDDDDSDDE